MFFLVFQSSSEAPIKATPRDAYSRSVATSRGISRVHGPHHVAQKFSTTICPRRSCKWTRLPFRSLSVKSAVRTLGAAARTAANAISGIKRNGGSIGRRAPAQFPLAQVQTNAAFGAGTGPPWTEADSAAN